LVTRKLVYRRLFEFWKIFGVTFGLSVVSGIVLAFEFGNELERTVGGDRTDSGAVADL
jgi:cytochrome d ubiquinol oxidase subunit I